MRGIQLTKTLLAASLILSAGLPCMAEDAPAKVANLLRSSDDLSGAEWKSFSRNATVVKSDVADPDGGSEAFRLTIAGGFMGQVLKAAVPGHKYLFSVWMKSATGSAQNASLAGENNPPAPSSKFQSFAVTAEWQRFSIAFDCPETNSNFRFSFRDCDVLAWHPQVEDATGKDPVEPSPYVENSMKAKNVKIQIPKNGPAPGVVQDIACWGDSLTAGAGGKPYTATLQEAASIKGRKVFNGGVGGQTSVQIKARFLEAPEKMGDLVIIWAGRNNYFDVNAVENDIAEMVSKLKTNRFLVLSVLNMENEVSGSGGHAAIVQLNKDLAGQYPDNFIEIRNALVAAYDKSSTEDQACNAKDVTPKSLRVDGIHLNSKGYKLVADRILTTLESKGWLAK